MSEKLDTTNEDMITNEIWRIADKLQVPYDQAGALWHKRCSGHWSKKRERKIANWMARKGKKCKLT